MIKERTENREKSRGGSLFMISMVLFLGLLLSCEKGLDCTQAAGEIVRVHVDVPAFAKITVFQRVQLIVKEGPNHEVEIESGENLLDEIEAKVIGDRLEITNENGCNLVREFGITKVYVTAPNITEIRNSSAFTIVSDGLLTYPSLRLLSENAQNPDFNTNGDFELELNVQSLRIVNNNLSNYRLSGTAQDVNIGIFAGDGTVNAPDLIIQNLEVFHRGSNDLVVNPQASITGSIVGNGDVISKNQPPVVDVEELFTGRLRFE